MIIKNKWHIQACDQCSQLSISKADMEKSSMGAEVVGVLEHLPCHDSRQCPMFYRGESSIIPRNLVNRGQFKKFLLGLYMIFPKS